MARLYALMAEGGSYTSRGSGSSQFVLMAVAVAAVALAITGFYFWNRRRKPVAASSKAAPEDVFAELCEIHELSKAEKQLIVQLAKTSEIAQPAALFVDPWTLDKAAAAADHDAPRYRTLRQKLFGNIEITSGAT